VLNLSSKDDRAMPRGRAESIRNTLGDGCRILQPVSGVAVPPTGRNRPDWRASPLRVPIISRGKNRRVSK